MKNMTLSNIAKACQGRLILNNHHDTTIKGVEIDSRKIEKDYLFIAHKGARVDGHDYIETAYTKGAIAVICESSG